MTKSIELRGAYLGLCVIVMIFGSWTAVLAEPFIPGIDVSRFQGDINWTSVKNAGKKFAFCKATEGVDFVDIKYIQNMNNASSAGVIIGPYHFGRPDSQENNPNDARDEANDFVDAIDDYYQQPGSFLRPVLDLERLPTLGEIPVGVTQREYLSEWVRDFADVVQTRLGFDPIIYTTSSIAVNFLEQDISQYDLWLVNLGFTPPDEPPSSQLGIWDDYAFWQHSHTGSVSGIAGAVDLDVFEGTPAELLEFVPFEPSADFDQDGDIDGRDFLAWQRGYGSTSGINFAKGDANHDGTIDNADLAVWQDSYGNPPLMATTAVPEPSRLALAAMLGAIFGFRRGS